METEGQFIPLPASSAAEKGAGKVSRLPLGGTLIANRETIGLLEKGEGLN